MHNLVKIGSKIIPRQIGIDRLVYHELGHKIHGHSCDDSETTKTVQIAGKVRHFFGQCHHSAVRENDVEIENAIGMTLVKVSRAMSSCDHGSYYIDMRK